MNKVALVTGGSRGIGFGIAEKLAAEQWDLVINGVRPAEAVTEPLEALRKYGVKVGYARGDVGSREGRAAILQTTRDFVAAWSKGQGAGSTETPHLKSQVAGSPSSSLPPAPSTSW